MAEATGQTVPAEGRSLWGSVKPYLEKESLAAFFVGVSSGFPYAMIGATLTTRLAQDDIEKSTITAFTLAFLVYNLKIFWAWIVDGVRIPVLGRLGQRVSWMLVAGVAVITRQAPVSPGATRPSRSPSGRAPASRGRRPGRRGTRPAPSPAR